MDRKIEVTFTFDELFEVKKTLDEAIDSLRDKRDAWEKQGQKSMAQHYADKIETLCQAYNKIFDSLERRI